MPLDNTRPTATQDKEIARRFVQRYFGEPDPYIHIRVKHDSTPDEWASRDYEGKLDDLWPGLLRVQAVGYAIYWLANIVPPHGGSGWQGAICDKDVTEIRSLFADCDNGIPTEFHRPPLLIVHTSPAKGQVLWPIVPGTLAVDACKHANQRIARRYKSDASAVNPSRWLRLPGSLHLKDRAHPHLVIFDDLSDNGLYGPEDASAILQGIADFEATEAPTQETPIDFNWDAPVNITQFKRYLEHRIAKGRVAVHNGEVTNGNATLLAISYWARDFGVSLDKARDTVWKIFNPMCLPPWPDPTDETFLKPTARAYAKGAAQNKYPGRDARKNPDSVFKGYLDQQASEDQAGQASDWDDDDQWDELTIGSDIKWQTPTDPFGKEADDPPDFDVGILPAPLRDIATDTGRMLAVKPSACLVPMLTALSSSIRGTIYIPLRRDGAWQMRLPHFAATLARSGSGKTEAQKEMIAPLRDFEAASFKEMGARRNAFAVIKGDWDKMVTEYEKQMKSAPWKGAEPAINYIREKFECPDFSPNAPPSEPHQIRSLVGDITTEALTDLGATNEHWIILQNLGEISRLTTGFDRHRGSGNKGYDESVYTELYDGNPAFVDRKGAGPRHVEYLNFSIVGGITPDVLQEQLPRFAKGGFFQRFMWASIGRQGAIDHGYERDARAVAGYKDVFRKLRQVEAATPIGMTKEARALWEKFQDDITDAIGKTSNDALGDHLVRVRGHFGKNLGIMAMVEKVMAETPHAPEVSLAVAEAVLQFTTEFLLPSSQYVFTQTVKTSPEWELAGKVSSLILTRKLRKPDTADILRPRDIYRMNHSVTHARKLIRDACKILEDHDWLYPLAIHRGEGPSMWAINPAVYSLFAKRAQEELQRKDLVLPAIMASAAKRRTEQTGEE